MKKKAHKLINNFWDIMFQPEMLVLPGQLAFFFILSVVPILTLISIGAASFNINLEFINSFIAQEFGENISNLLIPSTINPEANLGFIITFIFGFIIASNGASSIIVTSNTIYGIKDQGFIRRRVKSFIMTLFIVILFTFILIVPLFGQKIIEFIKLYSINNFLTKAFNILSSPISWIIIFILIKIIFTMAPDQRIPSSQTTYGALFTSVGWIISTFIYSFYINHYAMYSLYYGGLTNIIILMLWFYLLAYIFTIGMALNYRKHKDKYTKEED